MVETITVGSPLGGPKENAGAFTELREMKFLCPPGMQVINFLLQFPVECEFKSVSGFSRGAGNGQGNGRG